MTIKTRCNLCGSKNVKLLYKKNNFNILKCRACKFIFNDKLNILSDEVKFSESNNLLDINQLRDVFEREKKIYFERFEKELTKINGFKKKGKILDIGCGPGYFLCLAKQKEWETYGIDINKNSVEFCKNVLSLDVKYGKLDEHQYPPKYFDVITLFHVLEHIVDFEQAISTIKKILKPDGVLIIDVPNVNDARRILFGKNWAQFRGHHLWYFSKSTVNFLLRKYEFKIIDIKFHGGSEIVYFLDKTFEINLKKFNEKYFKYLKPIKNVFNSILNFVGFSEDLIVYAKNIDN